ncbi:MAG: M55 family metallopeptidase [Candidatus Eremiobacteraeota bacterium]|nr:M55 family metallopeptidase [Candidatus Eremiobacteraeota bacterium]MBV8366976.1 M55 family metallopeptidase [Candidatus Eremiobacteraeota bacterium]
MKLYISADMEGVAGITSLEQTNPVGQPEYARSCELMTGEVNAACEAALAAGAAEVTVNDSHWNMRNIIHEKLPPSVRLIRGSPKPLSMNQGIDPSYSAAAYIGYHAAGGTHDAVLDHTYTGETVYEVHLNGQACSEARINAAVAGAFGVPVIFLSGDQSACEDARSFLPWVETVEVKHAIGRYAADSLSPAKAREAIAAGITRALAEAGKRGAKPYTFESPVTLDIRFTSTAKADMAALLPGAERVGGRFIRYAHDDFLTVFRAFRVLMTLGGSVE